MARRASSGINSQALLLGVGLLALCLGGGYWFLNRSPDGFKAEDVNVGQYRENQNALVGNEVKATGTLVDRRNEGDAQMIALKIEEGGEPRFLPILIPDDFKKINLNLEQDYSFLLRFNSKGLAVATDAQAL